MNQRKERKLVHICEVCGKTMIMTPEEAHQNGWDYPPLIGSFGVVSPRTCGDCNMTQTVWWALVCDKKNIAELSDSQKETLARIVAEPESITPL